MLNRTVVILFVAAALGAPGCKKKPADQKSTAADDKGMAAMQAMQPAPRDAMRPADMSASPRREPARRPAAGLTPELKKQVTELLAKMNGKNWKAAREAKKALRALLKKEARNVALATWLAGNPDRRIAEHGLSMWDTLKKDKAHQKAFVAAMRRAFHHKSDRIRHRAVRAFWIHVDKDVRAQVAADVRKLFDDPSCIVQRGARDFTRSLLLETGKRAEVETLVYEALKADKCPIVQAWAAGQISSLRPKQLPPKAASALQDMIRRSPYYQVRCQALLALASVKHKAVPKLAKPFFKVAASTALVVYYQDGHSPYSFNIIAPNMLTCALRALAGFSGKDFHGDSKKAIALWGKLAKERLAPRPPKRACLDKGGCPKGTFCIGHRCQTPKQAWRAYWQYRRLSKCARKDPKAPRKNFTEEAAVKTGFGSHFMADWNLKKLYQKDQKKKFEAEEKKVRALKCPK